MSSGLLRAALLGTLLFSAACEGPEAEVGGGQAELVYGTDDRVERMSSSATAQAAGRSVVALLKPAELAGPSNGLWTLARDSLGGLLASGATSAMNAPRSYAGTVYVVIRGLAGAQNRYTLSTRM